MPAYKKLLLLLLTAASMAGCAKRQVIKASDLIRENKWETAYHANLVADAGLEFGKLWISTSCINQNKFPENVTGNSSYFLVADKMPFGTNGYYTTGIYPLAGNDVVAGNLSRSYSGTYVIVTTATITSGITGTIDTLVCKSIQMTVLRSFVPELPMCDPKCFHNAILLPNGTVLIAGGYDKSGRPTASAEIYNPAASTFSVTGSMHAKRANYGGAVLLKNNKVLVVDSSHDQPCTAELYDYHTGQFTLIAARLNHHRVDPAVTLLNNGNVLITSGGTYQADPTTEIYTPSGGTDGNGTFTLQDEAASLSAPRQCLTSVVLGNRNVLIAGGLDASLNPQNLAQVYNVTTNTFGPVLNMNSARSRPTATLLNNGDVLIAGGCPTNGNSTASAELYDPTTNTFTNVGSMSTGRSDASAVALPDGRVLVCGGTAWSNKTDIFDPASNTFSPVQPILFPRYGQTFTVLPNGNILVAGGCVNGMKIVPQNEIYGLTGKDITSTYLEYPVTHAAH